MGGPDDTRGACTAWGERMNIDWPEGKPDESVLVLGCGARPIEGATNHDRKEYHQWVNIWWDLNDAEWPDVGPFEYIVAEDVLEHLDSFIHFFDECWRLLVDDGVCMVQTTRWDSENVGRDPTHKRGYHVDSFQYLDPETKFGELYKWYTPYKWELVEVEDSENIVAVMRKRGSEEQ